MITETAGATYAPGSSGQAAGTNDLDKDAFLKLLITQLRNQDPLSPTDDKEFIAQLAQFSSLEQMQEVNKTLEAFAKGQMAFQAASLIGRTVSAVDKDGNTITGSVESIRFEKGVPVLKVGEAEIGLEQVLSIS